MSNLKEKIADMVEQHDVEMLAELMNVLLGRFENLNGADGILVGDVRDEIVDVFDDYMNNLAK